MHTGYICSTSTTVRTTVIYKV